MCLLPDLTFSKRHENRLTTSTRWPVTYLQQISPNVFAFLSWPCNAAAPRPAEAEAASQSVLIKTQVCLWVWLNTLTNAGLGFVVINIAEIAQAVIAALLILTLCRSTHARDLALVHIWKTQTCSQLENSKSRFKFSRTLMSSPERAQKHFTGKDV